MLLQQYIGKNVEKQEFTYTADRTKLVQQLDQSI